MKARKARKARKKRKACKKKGKDVRSKGTQAQKAREHVRQVST